VLEDQLSLAIGRGGQNVRLAANLTGFKIDVRSEQNPEEVINGGIAEKNDELVGNNEIIENIDTEEMKEKNIEENN